MRGRKPKPTYLNVVDSKVANGARDNKPGTLLRAPDWLTEDQKRIWKHIIDQVPNGHLHPLDEELLTAYVVACDLHRRASNEANKSDILRRSRKMDGVAKNVSVAVANGQATIMLRLAAELGLTPVTRSRVKLAKPPRDPNNPFDRFRRD